MKRELLGIAVLTAIYGVAFGQTGANRIALEATKKRAEEAAIMVAIESGVQTREQLEGVLNYISPDAHELKWRRIPWIPDLWRGRIEAAQQGKPMFIWAMNGDPLGCV